MFNWLGRFCKSLIGLVITTIIMAVIFFGVLPAVLVVVSVGLIGFFCIWLLLAIMGFFKGLAR